MFGEAQRPVHGGGVMTRIKGEITSNGYMERIDALRAQRDMTTRALARKAGITDAALRKIRERGGGGSADMLCRLARALGVSMDYLWTGKEAHSRHTDHLEAQAGIVKRATVDAAVRQ